MREQLGVLGAAAPVMLDPVLRSARRRREQRTDWRLPQHEHSRVLLTFSATTALYQAALALRLAGADKVLFPAYNCGHEIEPFLRAGARAGFYRVNERFEIDLDHLADSVDRDTRAVLVTHYFGFPQPVRAIRELCERRGLVLIEDCAHALFSCEGSEPLGLTGQLAVFSLRKSLPLPHGGALVCHDPRTPLPGTLPRPPLLSTLPKLLERYQKAWLLPPQGRPDGWDRAAFLAMRLLVEGARALRAAAQGLGVTQFDPDEESLDFPNEPLRWGVAAVVEQQLLQVDAPAVVAARRRNYALLLDSAERFHDAQPALSDLPAGVCPLYFPVYCEHPEALIGRLKQVGAAAVHWWSSIEHPAVPWERFPEAQRLKRRLVALPVHQDLNETHMQRIVELLSEPPSA